jgi:hypothetical protein
MSPTSEKKSRQTPAEFGPKEAEFGQTKKKFEKSLRECSESIWFPLLPGEGHSAAVA